VRNRRFAYAAKLLILFVIYYATAKFGLHLSAVNGFAAPVWPPSGIALAAIFILGYRYWPAIALGAFLVNHSAGASVLISSGVALGNTFEAFASAYLLKNFADFRLSLQRVKDVVGFFIFGSMIGTLVSATIGSTTLVVGHAIRSGDYASTWTTWWMGDVLGDIIVAPLIFVWFYHAIPIRQIKFKKLAEAILLSFLLLAVATYIFHGLPVSGTDHFKFGYLVFPVLIVIALRFGQIGSISAIFSLSVLAIWFTAQGFGPFAGHQLSTSLLYLQSYLGVTAMTFMIMAAIVSEQITTQKRQVELIQEAKLMSREQSRLRTLSKAQDEFTSLASHQLRTPATAVKQYMGLLLENYVGKLSKTQRSMLQKAYESNERQIKVLDDLLKVARVDLGNVRLNREVINLVDLVANIVELNAATIKSRQQTVSLTYENEEVPAYVDKIKFGMAVENIIDNACKYSLDGKKTQIIISKQGRKPVITVADHGVGISKKDMPKLFKKFTRINNPLSITVGGTGLGLYWAKKIIKLHGGSITVKSRASRGSSFKIILPPVK
jgi:signal transduction histidine kinase